MISHFAQLDEDNVVMQVIRASQETIDVLSASNGSRWIQCSYNTREGVHTLGGTPLRKNYPGMNWIYDEQLDAFYPPKTHNSWVLNLDTCMWQAPIPCPNRDGYTYKWDEKTVSWIEELIPPDESA